MAQHKTASKTSVTGRASTKSSKKAESRGTKQGIAKNAASQDAVSEDEVKIDRRRGKRRDEEGETEATEAAAKPIMERRQKVNRRRQIDPTTCERDYTDQEVEFMNALDDYKRKSGRMFPTCSEVLEVIHSLGYAKVSPTTGAMPTGCCSSSAKPMPSDWSAQSSDDCDVVGSVASSQEAQLTY